MADISWSAYALAMFTPEQRAAAVAATYEPIEEVRPIPPPPSPVGVGALVQIGGIVYVDGVAYDSNTSAGLTALFQRGWRYEGGRWIPAGSLGTVATPDQVLAQTGGRVGLSSVAPISFIPGGSVLGTQVPVAPAVLLPSFVGGRLGVVRIGGGMRAESGGTPRRVVMGPGGSVLPQVRMGPIVWGR